MTPSERRCYAPGAMEPLLEDIKVVELAEWGFVPSAAAVLADWGAEVIKVEHPKRADPMRGLMLGGLIASTGDYNYMVEQMNRGKRSVGLDLAHEGALAIFLKLVEQADVLITSFLEPARKRLKVTYDDVKPLNPRLIYARGHGQGQRGPDADAPGFDVISYWSRSGIAHMLTPQNGTLVMQRAAFGDVMAGMSLAGGIAAALFRRGVTGEGGLVDVSLLGTAMWNLAPDVISSFVLDKDDPRDSGGGAPTTPNPLVGTYVTSDKRFISLTMLQSDPYWPGFCRALEREELIEDPKYATFDARSENRAELTKLIKDEFGAHTKDEWAERLTRHECIWSTVQTPLEAAHDRQTEANGYLVQHPTHERGRVVASPVQYKNGMLELKRGAPEAGQHTEEVLLELGLDWDEIGKLKSEDAIS
ncbi:MAG: CoA transferase [Chloroflexi bacterium]|nr:CoA transferase [Chloroflexota bacterium]